MYSASVLEGTQKWLNRLIKDGKFSDGQLRVSLGKKVSKLKFPETLEEAKLCLITIRNWLRTLDDTTLVSKSANRLFRRTSDLINAVNCAISRRSFSLARRE